MSKQKFIDAIILIATGYTIAQGLLSLIVIFNRQIYNTIIFHYSDAWMGYHLLLMVPILGGVTFYLWLHHTSVYKDIKALFKIVFILQVVFTIIVLFHNYFYWGYACKRPTLFGEVQNAERIISCTRVSNYDSTDLQCLRQVANTGKDVDNLYGRKDIYYGNDDRIFMAFEDKSSIEPLLHDFAQVYENPELKISKLDLQYMNTDIMESSIIDEGEVGWDTSGILFGYITEFETYDNVRYAYAGFRGGQVSNDHYPFYEFLFVKRNQLYILSKQQRYYTDVAGIEYLEYAIISPFFSLFLTFFGMVILVVNFIKYMLTKSNPI
jgi:hypothetical protein